MVWIFPANAILFRLQLTVYWFVEAPFLVWYLPLFRDISIFFLGRGDLGKSWVLSKFCSHRTSRDIKLVCYFRVLPLPSDIHLTTELIQLTDLINSISSVLHKESCRGVTKESQDLTTSRLAVAAGLAAMKTTKARTPLQCQPQMLDSNVDGVLYEVSSAHPSIYIIYIYHMRRI